MSIRVRPRARPRKPASPTVPADRIDAEIRRRERREDQELLELAYPGIWRRNA